MTDGEAEMIALIQWFGNMFTRDIRVSEETLARLNAEVEPEDPPAMPWRLVKIGRTTRDAYRNPFKG